MKENLLFSKFRNKSEKEKKLSSGSFFFVFLSLILSILCFFIYLVKNSSFEENKIDAMRVSLQSSFTQTTPLFQWAKPSFEASQVAVFHQSQIAKMFPKSQISQDLANDEIAIFLPTNSIFVETSDDFKSSANVFFAQLKSLLNAAFVKNKYVVDIILFEDLPTSQDYPIFNHLTTLRAQKISDKMNRTAIGEMMYSIGIEKGNARYFKLHFRKRSVQ